MMATLPTSREVLTSLINSISLIPAPPEEYHGASGTANGNKLQAKLPPSSRPLLTTLHVLFPSVLLPALDLLDRGVVLRVLLDPSRSGSDAVQPHTVGAGGKTALEPPSSQPSSGDHPSQQGESPTMDEDDREMKKQPAHFYLVRSAAASSSTASKRSYNALPSSSTPYVVRLGAWNCSCANFTFDASQAVPEASDDADLEILEPGSLDRERHVAEEFDQEDAGGWSFGGMSSDGAAPEATGSLHRGEGGVPCCKHLLACLLAERWGDVMGRYVVEKRASKEEMAGLAVDV